MVSKSPQDQKIGAKCHGQDGDLLLIPRNEVFVLFLEQDFLKLDHPMYVRASIYHNLIINQTYQRIP